MTKRLANLLDADRGGRPGGSGGEPPPAADRTAWWWLRHEWTLAVLAGLLLAVVLTWPTLRHPWTTIPGDLGDPTLQAWQVAWSGHALLTDPLALWHSNTFFPERYTYAYSDTLLGYAPAGLFVSDPQEAVLRYNILYVLSHALAFVGAYALVRQVGARRIAAAVAAVAWAYAPWRLAHSGHLNILSIGGIALCLAMLARGHGWSLRDGHQPQRHRPGWALAGWLVAAWQVSLGFGIGLPLVYFLLAGCVVVAAAVGWVRLRRGRYLFGRRLLLADLGGGAVLAATCVSIGSVYLRVVDQNPQAERDLAWTRWLSPPLRGYVVAPADSWLWGTRHTYARAQLSWAPEMALLPGVTLIVLAALGLAYSSFRLRHRVLLGLGVLVSGALGLGSNLGADGDPGYLTLSRLLPGWDALRTPGRMMIWTSLLLAILAAGAITAIGDDMARAARGTPDESADNPKVAPTVRPGWRVARVALVLPLALVLVEGVNRTPHPEVPRAPTALRSASAPLLVLPSDGLLELNIMLWSTDGFPQVANGLAGFVPTSQQRTREITAAFPDPASVAYLRQVGIRSVVVLPDRLAGTAWDGVPNRPVDGLGITRDEVDGALVYHLDPSTG
ncbi:hypothetical protein OOK41_20355 [Micromonospora sp. NBC_01655]|uniref:hypothetical protein n=1 Tax=Micromonospora sp. NBC_01655 TaxID=2975983 RepID=UPI00224E2BC2|nr:hypothetical protein [Micromonospora sp. NBC_01655]MCX4472630.1 hypothetical protein [Micromonospora sp. NBC_01655]